LEGVTEKMTGALSPRSSGHVVVRVNPPALRRLNTLLSPAVKVVVTVNVANPPQQAAGNPEHFRLPGSATVPCSRFALTGVTLVSPTNRSGTPSPLVSQFSVMAVETVLPGRTIGTPVFSLAF